MMMVQTIEQIGDSLTLMTLMAWVMAMPGKSTSANMTILLFWIGLPIILISPFSGVLIDRFRRKTLLLSATALKGTFIFLIYLYIKDPGLVPLLYFLVFMKSFSTQFFIPAKSAYMPDVVNDKASLFQANSISTTAMVLTQITTYAVAGWAITKIGAQHMLAISSSLYIPAALLVALINSKENVERHKKIESFSHVIKDLADGFKFMFKNSKVLFITRRVFIMMICIIMFYIALSGGVLQRILAETNLPLLREPIQALGFMMAALGVGLVLGVVFIDRILKVIDEKSLIRILFPSVGVLICVLYFFPNYFYLVGCALVGGMGGMIVLSLAETGIQHETPENMRGRIFSAYYIFRNTGPLIASVIAGFLIRFMDEEKVMLISGVLLVGYGIFSLYTRRMKSKRRVS